MLPPLLDSSGPDAIVRAGGWSRTFRFGEWLGEPLTPLAASWLLPRLEDGLWAELDDRIGLPFRPMPTYALVNGRFYASMNFWNVNRLRVIWQLLRRGTLSRLMAPIDPARFPGTLEHWLDGWRRHLSASVGGSYQRLLAGLSGPAAPAAQAVTSLDWAQPTLVELTLPLLPADATVDAAPFAQVVADREQAEAAGPGSQRTPGTPFRASPRRGATGSPATGLRGRALLVGLADDATGPAPPR